MTQPPDKLAPSRGAAGDDQTATAPDRPQSVTVTLEGRDELARGYARLTFRADPPICGRAGHFAMIRAESWGDAPLLARPMSLLRAGARPSMLIKVVGDGTRRMASAPIGERFTLLAPLGTPWRLPELGCRPVLVAGGVGLPPLLLLAQELTAQQASSGTTPARPIALYGGRTAGDLPLADELDEVSEVRLATEDGSRGTHGRVTALLPAAIAECRQRGVEPEVYACGPQAMLRAVAELAAEHDVRCQVSLEALMGCGYGVCLGCPMPRAGGGYLYTCTEGPCVSSRDVDWT